MASHNRTGSACDWATQDERRGCRGWSPILLVKPLSAVMPSRNGRRLAEREPCAQRRVSGCPIRIVAGRTRPIPAHRRAPKLPDDRPRSFTVRIYEAAARGLRRSAVVHGRWLQGELKVIAASLDRSVIEQILNHLELGTQPPHQARRTSRARMARAAPLPPSVHAASVRQGELWPRAWTAPVLRVGRTLSELD